MAVFRDAVVSMDHAFRPRYIRNSGLPVMGMVLPAAFLVSTLTELRTEDDDDDTEISAEKEEEAVVFLIVFHVVLATLSFIIHDFLRALQTNSLLSILGLAGTSRRCPQLSYDSKRHVVASCRLKI